MDNLVAEHPGLVSTVTIGYSFEKRPLNVLKVHRSPRWIFLPMLLESRSSQAACHSRRCLQSGSSPLPADPQPVLAGFECAPPHDLHPLPFSLSCAN